MTDLRADEPFQTPRIEGAALPNYGRVLQHFATTVPSPSGERGLPWVSSKPLAATVKFLYLYLFQVYPITEVKT
jgi:hypothetical protein